MMGKHYEIKHLKINFDDFSIASFGVDIKIDKMAVELLKVLIDRAGNTVSQDELMEIVWHDKPSSPEVIPAAISRLRKMFKKTGVGENLITTVHKVGYRLELPKPIDNYVETTKPSRTFSIISISFLISLVIILLATFWYLNEKYYLKLNETQGIKTANSNKNNISSEYQTTQLYIIRHTEQKDFNTEDPELSPAGIDRANYWNKVLQHIHFDAAYTTDYKRNIQTANLVVKNRHLKLQYYYPMSFDVVGFLDKVKGKKVLIIGHSNTIPDMLNRLVGKTKYPPMSHKNYNQLYIITIGNDGEISSSLLHIEKP